MTDIACATSSSLASITGAVAAIAEPPQIDEPTPISVEIFVGIFSALHMMNAISSEAVIVLRIIGSDCTPVRPMTARFMPKPSRITAHWSIFLDVNLMPASNGARFFRNSPTVIPSTVKNGSMLLYVSPVLLLSNIMRLEIKPCDAGRPASRAKGVAEVIAAAVLLGMLLLLPLDKPSVMGIALWMLSVVCVSLLIFAFSEALNKLGNK